MQESIKEDRIIDWLRLYRTAKIGPVAFAFLLERFGSIKEAIFNLPEFSKSLGKKIYVPSTALIEEEYKKTIDFGAKIITWEDDLYPLQLRSISDSPPVLTIKGNIDLLQKKMIGIVGARNASSAGRLICFKIVTELGLSKIVSVSGLAKGIDKEAHLASLRSGTVAILAGGINNAYPAEHSDLKDKIASSGLLISEFPLSQEPKSSSFPQRNRIIAAISKGILVVEGTAASGSMITARYALDYGRDVFAVPGHPLDIRSKAVNMLIKQGAILVENAQDIICHMQQISCDFDFIGKCEEPLPDEKESKCIRENLINILTSTPISIDVIAEQYGYSLKQLRAALVEMEIAGQIYSYPGNKVSLVI